MAAQKDAETQVDTMTLNDFNRAIGGTVKCPSAWVHVYGNSSSGTWFLKRDGA